MKMRRILCVLLSLCVVFSCAAATVMAADGCADCEGTYTNGFCSENGSHYQAAPRSSDGVYEISNGGQLYWFAKLVDGGEQDACAVLTGDITVNAGVLEDGGLTSNEGAVDGFRKWNPIGGSSKKYLGVFDGQGHTVSGLYYDNTSTLGTFVGLFASLGEGALVMNVNVADSYILAKDKAGAIAGNNVGGEILNCSNASVIYVEGTSVGGIVGVNNGTVMGCTNSGPILCENEEAGGIAGINYGTIARCANTADVVNEENKNESYVGGIAGKNDNGGIEDCYNIGTLVNDGEYTGGIVGAAYDGSIIDCYNAGAIEGSGASGAIVGGHYSAPYIKNCYYLNSAESSYAGTEAKTDAQFRSGEVCYLLNGSTAEPTEGRSLVWFQTLGTDATPVFQGGTVYYGYESCADEAELGYSNNKTMATKAHTYEGENHVCVICGQANGECVDGDKDHACDSCGKELSQCEDLDKDHDCDLCGAEMGEHKAAEGSHTCGYCGEAVSQCADDDKDHVCDVCGTGMGEHEAAEGKHTCEYCGETMSQCADEDKDGKCDICGADLSCPRDETCVLYPFTDVNRSKWYHDALHYCVAEGLMKGTSDTTFEPDNTLSRAMLVQILYNVEGQPEYETDKSFSDVAEDEWYYDAIMWAAEEGIVLGHDDGTYGPDDDVTREQMVTILWRYAGEPETSLEEIPFDDAADIDEWAHAAVLWAYENDVVQGIGNNLYNPDGNSERAEAAQLMMNYFTK